MTPNIVITGASGFLGRQLMQRFKDLNPIGYAYSRAEKHGLKKVNLCDAKQLLSQLQQDKPHIIIHAAAEKRPDICQQNPTLANAINIKATETIAKYAATHNCWILYISTDYVFDGTQPPYKPNDQPNPINFYGQSKLAGEQLIQKHLTHFGILRVGILYGHTEHYSESAVSALIPFIYNKQPQSIDNYCLRYPTSTMDVANACFQLVELALADMHFKGIWHYCSAEPLTKYQMLTIIAEHDQQSINHIIGNDQPEHTDHRPYNCALDCQAIYNLGIAPPKPFNNHIKDFLSKLKLEKTL